MRVLEKSRAAFVRFFSKLTISMSRNVGADMSNATEPIDGDVGTKSNDSFTKRKCLFPYLNENKKFSVDDKGKILIELDAYLGEASHEENLVFIKKKICIQVYTNLV